MKLIGAKIGRAIPLAMALILLAGCSTEPICLTHSLWTGPLRNSLCEPASKSSIELWRTGDSSKVLVIYSEARDRNDQIRRRAFYVQSSDSEVQRRTKPDFVSLKSTNGLSPVTVVLTPQPTSPPLQVQAAIETDGRAFSLYRYGQYAGRYELPVYHDRVGTAEVIVLTPLAITGDAVIYGSMVGIVAGLMWWAGGGHTITL